MNIFISGVHGFLARHLAQHLSGEGHNIQGTTSSATTGTIPGGARPVRWRLGEPVDPRWLLNTDVVIHCAHDFRGGIEPNVEGTRALTEAARAAGVSKQIFISSLSARADAESDYGRSKYALEQALAGRDLIIVRPGTVIGNGGVFGRLADLVRKYPVLPLINGGSEKMYLIGVRDFCRATSALLTWQSPAEFNLYYEDAQTLRHVLQRVRVALRRKTLLVPVPTWLVGALLWIAEALGVRLPVNRDNLRGFRTSQQQIYRSNLSSILSQVQSAEEALRTSLAVG